MNRQGLLALLISTFLAGVGPLPASRTDDVLPTYPLAALREGAVPGERGWWSSPWPKSPAGSPADLDHHAYARKRKENTEKLLATAYLDEEVAVVVIDLEDGATLVDYRGSKKFVAASTYKLFTAYSMLRAVEQGDAHWKETLVNGKSLKRCFNDMIVWSDNDCPRSWHLSGKAGALQDQLKELGLEDTRIQKRPLETTALDLARFTYLLFGGDLVSEESLRRLEEQMLAQEFREGIPAGTGKGVKVANKVGFLDGNLHDVAVLRSDKGAYVMVVLTKNLSWEEVAEVARTVYLRL